jgi:hypothetical protein
MCQVTMVSGGKKLEMLQKKSKLPEKNESTS